MIKIKEIDGRYLKNIYFLGKEQFDGEFWFTKKFIKDSIKRKGINYGAFDNKKLIGVIFVDINDRPKVWIFFFDVKKEYRHLGIGQKLIKRVEKELPKGYFEMFVDLEKKDKLGINFYKKNGFKKVARIKNWFGKRTFGLLYCKEIGTKR